METKGRSIHFTCDPVNNLSTTDKKHTDNHTRPIPSLEQTEDCKQKAHQNKNDVQMFTEEMSSPQCVQSSKQFIH